MTAELLKTLRKEDVLTFITEILQFDKSIYAQFRHIDHDEFKKEHRRFEMSGYDGTTGDCTVCNQAILNEFADLGIYDYTSYLFLDFYKGTPTLYMKYFHDRENLEFDFHGLGTTEIIYRIFELTIFSDEQVRRR